MEHQTLKFRTSCDACATSKVKCDKQQPACRRCLSSGTKCIYGISRKHGKQAHRRRIAAEEPSNYFLSSDGNDEQPSQSRTGSFDAKSGLQFDNLLQDMGLLDKLPLTQADSLRYCNAFTPPSPVTTEGQTSTVETTPDFHELHVGTGMNQVFPGINQSHDDIAVNPIEGPLSYMNMICEPTESTAMFATSDTMLPLVEPTTSPVDVKTRNADSEYHQCYGLASEALELLNLERRFSIFVNHMPNGSEKAALPLLNLDHILEVNKRALNTLQQVLDCPCSDGNAPLALLNASIVSKINYWYRVGGRIIRTATQRPASSTPYAPSVDPLSRERFERFEHLGQFDRRNSSSLNLLPMSIGTFDIDATDRATLSRLLLLSELRKTSRLVERLQNGRENRDSAVPSSRRGSVKAGTVQGLYNMLGNWLNGEVAKTIHEVKIQDREDLPKGPGEDQFMQYGWA